jgi:hypothetical protein
VANRRTTATRMCELEDGNQNENLTLGTNQIRGGKRRDTSGNGSASVLSTTGAMEDTVSPEYPRSISRLLPNPTH